MPRKAGERLAKSTAVLKTILVKNDTAKALLNKAECVMVYPIVKKVGLGISSMGYYRGVMVTCAGDSFDESSIDR